MLKVMEKKEKQIESQDKAISMTSSFPGNPTSKGLPPATSGSTNNFKIPQIPNRDLNIHVERELHGIYIYVYI